MSACERSWDPYPQVEQYGRADTRKEWLRRYARRLVAVDVAAVVLAVGLAQWLRFGGLTGTAVTHATLQYTAESLGIAFAWLSLFAIFHSRSPGVIGAGFEEYRRVSTATIATFGAVAIVSMLLKLEIARGYLLIAFPIGVVGTLLGRHMARRLLEASRRRGRCATRVLLVGSECAVVELTRSLVRDEKSGYCVVGACIPGGHARGSIEIGCAGEVPLFGDETQVVEAVATTQADAVALTATEHLGTRGIRKLSWELEKFDVDLLLSPGIADVAGPRLIMRPIAGFPLIHVEKPRYSGAKQFQKRAFDIFFAAAVLLLSLPVTTLIAVAIKLSSKGPIVYRSERIGLDGTPFQMIKFRTMVEDAEHQLHALAEFNHCDGGVLFKMTRDPRVTPMGKVLRRYSIDEIPQFWNVLKGEMSVVGPRPPLAREVLSYDPEVKRRLLVRPGITGLWQVSGRSDLSWDDAVRLDLFYVENWSMMADIVIVIRTLKAVVTASGAY